MLSTMKSLALAAVLSGAAAFVIPAIAADAPAPAADKSAEWCTDAHMKTMDEGVGKMTDAAKKKEAMMHLDMSKEAMKKSDMPGCAQHMTEVHKSMGM